MNWWTSITNNIGQTTTFTYDPILFAGGDINLYGYVLNDPVNLIDSDGQIAVIAGIVAAAVVGIAVYAAVDTLLRRAQPAFQELHQARLDAADGKPGAEQRAQRAQEEIARAAQAAGQFCIIGLSAAPTPLTSPAP